MKYELDKILEKVIIKANHLSNGIWEINNEDYRGGILSLRVEGSEELTKRCLTDYNYGYGKKFNEHAIKEFGNLKIATSQIRGMGYFPTIAGYEAVVSNLKTLNPDYLIFKMPVQENAPSGKIIIPQGKNEVFANLMTDVANFLENKYK